MSRPLITLSGLTAGYTAPVVGPLSCVLAPGEVLGVWGRNGCGKSTLLKAIAGLARVFSGSVERAPGLRLGYLGQRPQRLEQMPFSGREYLAYAGAEQVPPARLEPLLGRRVDRLSGGQFQLLGTWAVLGGAAGLVLLDEPTNNLDPDGERLLAELLRAGRGGRGVLVVSHERAFLERACTRILEVGACSTP